jgi:hypothetical protein
VGSTPTARTSKEDGDHHGETHNDWVLERAGRGPDVFSTGTGRFTIGITGRACITWHVHLTAAETRQFVGYVDQRALSERER